MLLYACLCIVLVLFFYHNHKYNYWKSRNVPFEPPFLIFGNLFDVIFRKEHIFEKIRKIYNKFSTLYVGIFFFYKPVLMINSPEILKKILVKDFKAFVNRDLALDITVDPLAFYTLFFARDEQWRDLKNKFSPAFTHSKTKDMFELMQECADKFSKNLKNFHGQTVEIKELLKKLCIDTSVSCALGVKCEDPKMYTMSERLTDSRNIFRNLSMFGYFFMHLWVKILRCSFADPAATDYLGAVFQKSLNQRRLSSSSLERQDFVQFVVDMEKKYKTIIGTQKDDDTVKISQALTFCGANTDSNAILLAFTLYELSRQPDLQSKLRKSLQCIKFSYETIQGLKYLDMVVNETLRKYPLTGFLLRMAKTDYLIEETGFLVPKDTAILVPVSGIHYDEKYYPDPMKYDPERFSDNNRRNIVEYSFLPFGEGPRSCIGKSFATMMIKISLANIIRDFEFETTEETINDMDFDTSSTFIQNKGGLYLKVHRVG